MSCFGIRLLACSLGVVFAAACRPPVPLVVAPKAVANPLPTPEQIAETQAAKDGRTGAVRVAYCVDPDGKAQDVKVIEPFEPSFEQCSDTRIDLR